MSDWKVVRKARKTALTKQQSQIDKFIVLDNATKVEEFWTKHIITFEEFEQACQNVCRDDGITVEGIDDYYEAVRGVYVHTLNGLEVWARSPDKNRLPNPEVLVNYIKPKYVRYWDIPDPVITPSPASAAANSMCDVDQQVGVSDTHLSSNMCDLVCIDHDVSEEADPQVSKCSVGPDHLESSKSGNVIVTVRFLSNHVVCEIFEVYSIHVAVSERVGVTSLFQPLAAPD